MSGQDDQVGGALVASPTGDVGLIDGAALLDEVRGFNDRFVALPSEAARVFVPLWVAHAHLLDVFDSTPRAAFMSPEPGSGKTRQLEVIETMTPNPMHAAGVSLAVLFRSVASMRPTPTILHDEIDTVFGPRAKEHEELRGFLNSGHRRGAKYYRCVGDGSNQKSVPFPSYSALAVAGLGNLPRTIRQRSVVVRMHRRAPGERVEPFRHRIHGTEGNALGARLAAWAEQARHGMGGSYPEMPEGVEDRDADVWEPLIMVADAAGGHWPEAARSACRAFVAAGKAPQAASLGIRLLNDVRRAFGERRRIEIDALLDALAEMKDSPWSDLRGHPLSRSELRRMLGEYEIEDKKIRFGEKTEMGYHRAAFAEAWTRYPLPEKPEQSEQPEQPCSQTPDQDRDREHVPEHHHGPEHHAHTASRDVPDVPDVPRSQEEAEARICPECGEPVEGSTAMHWECVVRRQEARAQRRTPGTGDEADDDKRTCQKCPRELIHPISVKTGLCTIHHPITDQAMAEYYKTQRAANGTAPS